MMLIIFLVYALCLTYALQLQLDQAQSTITSTSTNMPLDSSNGSADDVVLRHGQWMAEGDCPLERKFILSNAIPLWQSIRSAQPGAQQASLGPADWFEAETRQVRSRWLNQVLDALKVPLSTRISSPASATDYMPFIRRAAEIETHNALQMEESKQVLDCALHLASLGSPNAASEFARQGPAQAVLVAASVLDQKRRTSAEVLSLTTGANNVDAAGMHANGASPQAYLPPPLMPFLQSSLNGSGRSRRNTQRSLMACLQSWRHDCQHIPHLWLDGLAPARLPWPANDPNTLANCQAGPLLQLGIGNSNISDPFRAAHASSHTVHTKSMHRVLDPDSESEGQLYHDAEAEFAQRLANQAIWRAEILRCGLHC